MVMSQEGQGIGLEERMGTSLGMFEPQRHAPEGKDEENRRVTNLPRPSEIEKREKHREGVFRIGTTQAHRISWGSAERQQSHHKGKAQ